MQAPGISIFCAVISLMALLPAGTRSADSQASVGSKKFAALSEQFMKDGLALSPSSASQAGYHVHVDPKTGQNIELDAELDDLSLKAMDEQRAFYARWRERFRAETPLATLNAQDRADWQLIDDQIGLNLLEFDKIQNYRHNPTVPVELIGNALFLPAHAGLRAPGNANRPRPLARRPDSPPARSGEGVSQRRRSDLHQHRR